MSSGYRLAPAVAARLLGLLLVVLAAAVVALTVLASALAWPPAVILVAAIGGVALGLVAAWWLLRGLRVVVLDERGYRVRMVRGAGVRDAAWLEVGDAVTADVRGVDCVVLRLKDGRATSIPVAVLAADRNAFVAEVRQRLKDAEGLRPL
ncbi:hypothetical protein [Nocardioides coralli]|uniref:hypothetical protein n=1 Tax=Nocardioides coralli TaxID=2872154 RepID=UPI001CA41725|nr:hypothetical protein [Nocardioides coralli]QZY29280.1 hypothetical protein K6T13_00730 [Nocardioides coralli]